MRMREDREYEGDHVDAGCVDDTFRWIEAGQLRLEEDREGATVVIANPRRHNACGLSEGELEGLATWLARRAARLVGGAADKILQIENCALYVQTALEAWDARARIEEVHPPYDELTRALDALRAKCRELRDDLLLAEDPSR